MLTKHSSKGLNENIRNNDIAIKERLIVIFSSSYGKNDQRFPFLERLQCKAFFTMAKPF